MSVYSVGMPRTRIRLPDSPAEKTGSFRLDTSALAQDDANSALGINALDLWLEEVAALAPTAAAPGAIQEAVAAAKDRLDLRY